MRNRLQIDIRRKLEVRALLAAGLLDAAVAPADFGRFHAVLVLQDAADPDVGGDLVFRQADGLAFQILRPRDAAVGPDVDAGMAKQARDERRDRDVVVLSARDLQRIARERQLADVEFLVLEGAVERLLGLERRADQLAALDLDAAVEQRARPVVVTAGEADPELQVDLPNGSE